jgi:ankyrin repeat protein
MNLYILAQEGKLNTIDTNLLTQENLTTKDKNEWTPLHWAAEYAHLAQIPTKFLTIKNLLIKDDNHETPLSIAAQSSQLDIIPYNVLIKLQKECVKTTTLENYEISLATAKNKYRKEIQKTIKNKLGKSP